MQPDTPDVLLVTNTKGESQAVLGVFQAASNENAKPVEIGYRTYFDLGAHNGARVFLTQSEMDSNGGYATERTVKKALETLKPGTVIQVSVASGTRNQKVSERSSKPFFSSLTNAARQWEGPGVVVHSVLGDVEWILVEGAVVSNAASVILSAFRSAPFGDTPTLAAETEIHSSLPKQAFFFGREKELAIIADAISPDLRTWGVLIDGPGGIGKTSLAVRAAHLAPVSHFPRKIFLSAKIRELTSKGEQPRTDFIPPNYLALLSELARELGDKDLAKVPESERADSVRRTLAGARALIVIDNLETLLDTERVQLYQFLSRLPEGNKAIVTSRRRSDVDARVIRVDRLDLKDALLLIGELAKTNRTLAAATMQERQMLYEFTGGNPLLLGWTAGQLGRRGSQCRTVSEACAFLKNAPADNDPLEYIFGDLLDTFTASETAVLAVLTHFSMPVAVKWIAEFAGLAVQQAQVALEDLADRALIAGDPGAQTFYLPPLAAKFLGAKRPEVVAQTGERLAERAYTLAIENGFTKYESFPVLEAEWSVISAALPWLLRGENARLQRFCGALFFFLDFSGRWDDWQRIELQAEEKAFAANDLHNAGWRAFRAGWVDYLRGQGAQVLMSAERADSHWRKVGVGPQELAYARRLRAIGHQMAKNNSSAAEAFREALQLFRSVDAESYDVSTVLDDLADIEVESGDYGAAEANYKEALRIATKIDQREGIATYKGNLVRLAMRQKNWPLAEKLGREALPLAESLGRQELIGLACGRLAQALQRQGFSVEGLPYAKRAVDIFTNLAQTGNLAWSASVLKDCERDSAPTPPS